MRIAWKWFLILTVWFMVGCGSAFLSQERAMKPALQAGHGRRDVTPALPVFMGGFAARTQPARAVHDPLYANVLALSDGTQKVLLITLDVCNLDAASVGSIKHAVQGRTGLAPERMLINTSHTHSGPLTAARTYGTVDPKVIDRLAQGAAEAANDALRDLAPAALSAGSAPVDIGANRRQKNAQGQIIIGIDPAGPRLAELTLWHFARPGKCDLLLFSVPVHATVMDAQNLMISADWPGAAVNEIEREHAPARAVFLQGCAGDQGVHRAQRTFETVAAHGRTVAAAATAALVNRRNLAALPLIHRTVAVPLPLANNTTWACPLHGLRLGEAALVGLSGEPFVEYALFARRQSAAASTMALGYTDGSVGYLVTATTFAEGGYELDAWRYLAPAPFTTEIETVIKRELTETLTQLYR